MNFFVRPYDPIDEAMELFAKHNATPPEAREQTEEELVNLVVYKIKQHERERAAKD